jgi:hypothetical protein
MKPGRPRTITGEKSVQASFSVSVKEYRALTAEAQKSGMSLSSWLRAQVTKKKTPPVVETGGA